MDSCLTCSDHLTLEELLRLVIVCNEGGTKGIRLTEVEGYTSDCIACSQYFSLQEIFRDAMFCDIAGIHSVQVQTYSGIDAATCVDCASTLTTEELLKDCLVCLDGVLAFRVLLVPSAEPCEGCGLFQTIDEAFRRLIVCDANGVKYIRVTSVEGEAVNCFSCDVYSSVAEYPDISVVGLECLSQNIAINGFGLAGYDEIIELINSITGEEDTEYIDALNSLCVFLGGEEGHEETNDAINEIGSIVCVSWVDSDDNLEALNAIATCLGGEAGHETELEAWQEIAEIGIGVSLMITTDSEVEFQENQTSVTTITVSEEGGVFSLLETGDYEKFSIDPDTGVLTVESQNYEYPDSVDGSINYVIQVQYVKDARTATKTITCILTDEVEALEADLSEYLAQIAVQIDQNRRTPPILKQTGAVLVESTDDGTPSDYTVFAAYLDTKGKKGSIALIAETIDNGGLTTAQINAMVAAGHDVWYHSYREANDLLTLSDAQLRADIESGLDIIDNTNAGVLTKHVPPYFTSFNENYRSIACEYFTALRNGIYNHKCTWDTMRRTAMGALTVWLRDIEGGETGAEYLQQGKDAIDYAIANNCPVILYHHDIQAGANATYFQALIDYAIAQGIEFDTMTGLHNRLEAHRGHWDAVIATDKYQAINYEEHDLPATKTGMVIISAKLADAGDLVTAATKAGYDILILTDTADAAHAYACPDNGFRAKLRALAAPITSMRKMQQRELMIDISSFTGTFANMGIEHFIGLLELYLHNCTITGAIPRTVKYMDRLTNFYCPNCTISGSIPVEISHIHDLQIFDVGNLYALNTAPGTGNMNAITGYEAGAFAKWMIRLNKIILTDNRLSSADVDQILTDIRDMVEAGSGFMGMYTPATLYHQIYLDGRFMGKPSATGLAALAQLESASSEFGSPYDWDVRVNIPSPVSTLNDSDARFIIYSDHGLTEQNNAQLDDTDLIREWLDYSKYSNHLRHTANFPIYRTNQINRYPSIQAVASTVKRLYTGDVITLSRSGAYMMILFRIGTLDSTARGLLGNTVTTGCMLTVESGGTGTIKVTGASSQAWCNAASTGITTGTWYTLEVNADGGTVVTYLNGNQIDSRTPSADFSWNTILYNGAAGFFGDLVHIRMYDRSMSESERTAHRTEVETRYGL